MYPWLILLIVPQPDITPDQCDIIEINHVYRVHVIEDPPAAAKVKISKQGSYLLFWDWNALQNNYVCIAWRVWREKQYPMRRGGMWHIHFHDKDLFREVQAVSFRETWTPWDAEVENRHTFDPAQRRGLTPK